MTHLHDAYPKGIVPRILWGELRVEELKQQVEERIHLHDYVLVGTLYRSIVGDEIIDLRKLIAEKKKLL